MEAIRERAWPPTEVKSPPANTRPPLDTLRARTTPLAFGFQDSRAPVEALHAARWFRAVLLTWVNSPPRKMVSPR
jgi:hypothetical protein